MKYYTDGYGPQLVLDGTPMQKRPSVVYMLRMDEPFRVVTNEGELTGNAGDFLAHDPLSGHVWPVSAAYVEMHYLDATPPCEDGDDEGGGLGPLGMEAVERAALR